MRRRGNPVGHLLVDRVPSHLQVLQLGVLSAVGYHRLYLLGEPPARPRAGGTASGSLARRSSISRRQQPAGAMPEAARLRHTSQWLRRWLCQTSECTRRWSQVAADHGALCQGPSSSKFCPEISVTNDLIGPVSASSRSCRMLDLPWQSSNMRLSERHSRLLQAL
jgi:hypothetical protein